MNDEDLETEFDDAPAPPPARKVLISIGELRAHIAQLDREAKRRAEREASRAAHEDWDHPDPPTLDPVLKHRARAVWLRMRALGLWHAPWHHEEIWVWAGTTDDGQAWLQREVEFWEKRVELMELQVRLTKIRICEEVGSLSDGTTLENLNEVLALEREGRARKSRPRSRP